jgi:hypothetical protein
MKEIDGKLYGYEYELKADPTVEDLTEFRAVDSGSLFIALNGLWYEQPVKWAEIDALSSSGGGGGGSDIFYATIEFTDGESIEFTCDKTFDELVAAHEAGKLMFARLVFVNGSPLYEEISPITVQLDLNSDEISYFIVTQPAHASPGEFVSQYEFSIYPDPADNSAEFYAFTGVDSNP